MKKKVKRALEFEECWTVVWMTKKYWNVDLRAWESLKYWMGVKGENSRLKTVGGSLVPATNGSRRPEPSSRFIKPKLRLKLDSFSSQAEPELSFFQA